MFIHHHHHHLHLHHHHDDDAIQLSKRQRNVYFKGLLPLHPQKVPFLYIVTEFLIVSCLQYRCPVKARHIWVWTSLPAVQHTKIWIVNMKRQVGALICTWPPTQTCCVRTQMEEDKMWVVITGWWGEMHWQRMTWPGNVIWPIKSSHLLQLTLPVTVWIYIHRYIPYCIWQRHFTSGNAWKQKKSVLQIFC